MVDLRRHPFFYQPNPARPFFVPAKAKRVVSRGPREYYMVGEMPDGREVEVRLSGGVTVKFSP